MKGPFRRFCTFFVSFSLILSFTGCFAPKEAVPDVLSPTPALVQSPSPAPAQTPLPTPTPTPASDVVWADPVFEAEVRQALMKPEGVPVMKKELQAVTSLSLTMGVKSLADLKYFENLEELWVVPSYELEQPLDLTPIGELKKLIRLELSLNGGGYDLGFLKELPQLTSLTLQWYCNGADISALSSLTDLTELGLIEMEGLDLKKLSGLTRLTALSLKFCDVRSLTPLEGLINLRSLALQGSAELKSLSPLTGMEDLEFLDLTGCLKVKSLEPLRGLEKLNELFVVADPALDLSPVAHVKYINGQENAAAAP